MHYWGIQIPGLSSLLFTLIITACLPAVAQDRYSFSNDGQEVTDSKTGLIWRRCVEGMRWSKPSCTGQPVFTSQTQALMVAKATGDPWRLPTLKELSSIVAVREVEKNKAAIDPHAFPATPLGRYWTSTSVGPAYFMFVSFGDGSAGEGARNLPGAVRLVRDK